jgi:hypothetical protein
MSLPRARARARRVVPILSQMDENMFKNIFGYVYEHILSCGLAESTIAGIVVPLSPPWTPGKEIKRLRHR